MEKTMKAVVTYAPGDNRYEDFPMPELEDGEVLLKVKGCGICAGDLKAFHGGIRVWGTSEADRYMEPPCIPGHEFYGDFRGVSHCCDADLCGQRSGDGQIGRAGINENTGVRFHQGCALLRDLVLF